MASDSDRTIPATPRRREQARREGLAPSAALPAWAASAGVAILLAPSWARATIPAAAEMLRAAVLAAGGSGQGEIPWPFPPALVWPTVGVVAASAAVGLAVRTACDGLSWQPARAALDLRRIDPIRGFTRIFSLDTFLAMGGAAVALGTLGAAAVVAARSLVGLQTAGVGGAAAIAGSVAWRAAAWLVAGAAVVAAGQWALARRRFERRIRMTPQEAVEEAKDMRADPRIRLFHMQRRRPQPTASSTSGTA